MDTGNHEHRPLEQLVERIGGAHRGGKIISSLMNFCKSFFSGFVLQLASARWELNLEQAMMEKLVVTDATTLY